MTALRRSAAVVVLLACVAGSIRFVLGSVGTEEFGQHVLMAPALLAYPVVAAVILWRRSHPVAYLLLAMGAVLALDLVEDLLDQPVPPGSTVGWRIVLVVSTTLFPLFAMLVPALGLRFPDGRRLSRRWRYAEWIYVIGVAAVLTAMLLSPTITGGVPGTDAWWELPNPLATSATEPVRRSLELVATATLPPAVLLAIANLIIRFRRSVGVARQQLRVLTYGFLAVLLSWPLLAGAALLVAGDGAAQVVNGICSMLVLAVPPFAMGIAITRYRLYDLERLVSRTLSYAIVTVLLAAVYAGTVVGLSAALRSVAGTGDLVVAVSTLVVAAAFQPVRRRVQSAVDRRFNRRRYDAARTVEDFSQRLRDEVDMAEVRKDLVSVVRRAVAPADVSLVVVDGGLRP